MNNGYRQNPQGQQPNGPLYSGNYRPGQAPQQPYPQSQPYQQNQGFQQSYPYQQNPQQGSQPYPPQSYQPSQPYPPQGFQQSQPYPPQGYQPSQPYPPQGFQQSQPMGAAPRQPDPAGRGNSRSMPMPGGGYGAYGQRQGAGVPRTQQGRRGPINLKPALQVMVFGVLPLLFLAVMIFTRVIVFVKAAVVAMAVAMAVLTALTCAGMWLTHALSPNTTTTASAVYSLLSIVALVAALTMSVSGPVRGGTPQSYSYTQPQSAYSEDGTPVLSEITPPMLVTPTPTVVKDPLDTEAVKQLNSFFFFWQGNKQNEMLTLCAPSWISSLPAGSKPANELFKILANRSPIEYTPNKITGTENDVSRTVTVTCEVDLNRNVAPVTYRFSILMVKENGAWYIDPRSLSSSVKETATPEPTEVVTEAPEIVADPTMTLYYNPGKGSFYHADPYCRLIAKKYTPLQGTFMYAEVGNAPYKDLSPCGTCNAPLPPLDY